MKGINTKPSLLIDKTFVLYFNEIEIGLIITTEKHFKCYVLGKWIEFVRSDENDLKRLLHEYYVKVVKQLAESLGENLIFSSEIGDAKKVERKDWKVEC